MIKNHLSDIIQNRGQIKGICLQKISEVIRMYSCIIIDDEKSFVTGLTSYINSKPELGFDVVGSFYNGEDALNFIKTNFTDLVITDVQMPDISGLELSQILSEKDDIETIIISAHSKFEYAQQAILHNVLAYILKPIDFELLDETLLMAKNKIQSKVSHNAVPLALEKHFNDNNDIKDTKKSLIDKAKKYIYEHYSDDLSLNTMASYVYLSPAYFSRIFTEIENVSFSTFLNNVRIEKSIELLKEQYKLEIIAKTVGFSSTKYFVQKFKAHTGLTPTNYYRNVIIGDDINE